MEEKRTTSHRLSTTARRLLLMLAEKYSITQTATLELMIREEAYREGLILEIPEKDHQSARKDADGR